MNLLNNITSNSDKREKSQKITANTKTKQRRATQREEIATKQQKNNNTKRNEKKTCELVGKTKKTR